MPSSTLPFIACYIMDWITSGVRESSNVVLVVELIRPGGEEESE